MQQSHGMGFPIVGLAGCGEAVAGVCASASTFSFVSVSFDIAV